MAHKSHSIFSIPQDLLVDLVLRDDFHHTRSADQPSLPTHTSTVTSARSCNVCNIDFKDVDQQRAHFRSDWHRYNAKSKLNGHTAVSEAAFDELIHGLDDSLSGSESMESDKSCASDNAVEALLSRQAQLTNRSPSPTSAPQAPQTALAWFHSAPSTQLGVYKQVFEKMTGPLSFIDELRSMQQPRDGGRKWALFMTAGGHFAGAIARVSADIVEEKSDFNRISKSHKEKKAKPDVEILHHKTFHRYTTRRKQGGSQSVNDNAKGNAKSAGAQLRRYGEQALRDDIRGLLADWSHEIGDCERIWIRASTSNRKIFLDDYTDSVIKKGDERLRTFPFPTRRPTQSELTRCLLELTFVKITHFTQEMLKIQDDALLASLPKVAPQRPKQDQISTVNEKKKAPQLSKEDVNLREKWSRLMEMIIRGRLEPLKTFWGREVEILGGVNSYVPDWTGYSGTLLQLAAEAGHESIVAWLLQDAGADPTIAVPSGNSIVRSKNHDSDDENIQGMKTGSHRTAYDLARTRGVRSAFRRAAAADPNRWDWLGKGRVPSLLSREMEDIQDERKKTRAKSLKEKIREREAKEQDNEEQAQIASQMMISPITAPITPAYEPSGSRRLGGSKGAAESTSGLSPEMRMKIERERRARAAEARMKKVP